MSPEPFVTADDIAEHLKIKRRQVLHMTRNGIIPGHPVSFDSGRRVWRFKLSEVDQAIVSRTAKSEIVPTVDYIRITTGSPRSRKEQSHG